MAGRTEHLIRRPTNQELPIWSRRESGTLSSSAVEQRRKRASAPIELGQPRFGFGSWLSVRFITGTTPVAGLPSSGLISFGSTRKDLRPGNALIARVALSPFQYHPGDLAWKNQQTEDQRHACKEGTCGTKSVDKTQGGIASSAPTISHSCAKLTIMFPLRTSVRKNPRTCAGSIALVRIFRA